MFRIQLGLAHPSIVSILQCVCTHPINLMSIHLLHYIHGNEHMRIHDAIRDILIIIVQDVDFHVK